MSIPRWLKNLFANPAKLREARRRKWERKWCREEFEPNWSGRGIAKELVELRQNGWLPASGSVLDIGCGLGEIAAWFARQGHEAVGVDIAQAAVDRATLMHVDQPGLKFIKLDITNTNNLPDRKFDILVDRGCLHTIPDALVPAYFTSICRLSAPNARIVLFTRAFRKQGKSGTPLQDESQEERQLVSRVKETFKDAFQLEAYSRTSLGRPEDPQSLSEMPGIMFKLVNVS